MNLIKVCHLTSVHKPDDVRIFHKECVFLAKYGFDTTLIATNTIDKVDEGVKIIGVNNTSTSRLRRMIIVTRSIYKKAILVNADIYHFHDPELMFVGLKLKRKGKKVIYDVHEDLPKSVYGRYWIPFFLRPLISFFIHFFEMFVAKKLDGIITVTESINKRFKKVNKLSIVINNYPIINEAVINLDRNKKENHICYIGGISVIRGNSVLIDAMNLTENDIKLQIAGEYDPLNYKEVLIQKPGWLKVIDNGWLSRKKVNELMSNSLAGIITYLPLPNHISAQPNKMFEYMSAGLPVIASNFTLWKEIVEGNKCGICVDPTNSQEIAMAINKIFENPKMALNMGNNGKNAVLKKYNWKKQSQKLIEFYNKLFL